MSGPTRERARHVLVGIPTLDGMVTADLAAFLCTLPLRGESIGCQFSLQFVPGLSPVHYARNMFVKSFFASDAELLWFIDCDMIPNESSLALLDVDADIVVGRALAIQRQRDGTAHLTITAYPKQRESTNGFHPVLPTVDTPTPIVASGAGNLLIHRRVLEDPKMRLPSTYSDWQGRAHTLDDEPDAAPAIFRTVEAANGRILLGEDMDFVHRAAALGYRCMYQPKGRMGHRKVVNLDDIERLVADATADVSTTASIPKRNGHNPILEEQERNARHGDPPVYEKAL